MQTIKKDYKWLQLLIHKGNQAPSTVRSTDTWNLEAKLLIFTGTLTSSAISSLTRCLQKRIGFGQNKQSSLRSHTVTWGKSLQSGSSPHSSISNMLQEKMFHLHPKGTHSVCPRTTLWWEDLASGSSSSQRTSTVMIQMGLMSIVEISPVISLPKSTTTAVLNSSPSRHTKRKLTRCFLKPRKRYN